MPKITIGIISCMAGIGVTHLSITLANYLTKIFDMKVAILEFGNKEDFTNLSKKAELELFWLNKVCYYPKVKKDSISKIMNQNFHYYILDLGHDIKSSEEEFLRCTLKIVIGSLNPWKKKIYYNYIETIKKCWGTNEQYLFLSLFGNKKENKKCHCIYGISMESLPFIADPFQIETQHFTFLNNLV